MENLGVGCKQPDMLAAFKKYEKDGLAVVHENRVYVLQELVEKCLELGIHDIQLFCAKGKAGFYEKHGFVVRRADAPGMEYSYIHQNREEVQ